MPALFSLGVVLLVAGLLLFASAMSHERAADGANALAAGLFFLLLGVILLLVAVLKWVTL